MDNLRIFFHTSHLTLRMYAKLWFRDAQNHQRTETLAQCVSLTQTVKCAVAFRNSKWRWNVSRVMAVEIIPADVLPPPGDGTTSADRSSAKPVQTVNGELQRTSERSCHRITCTEPSLQRMSAELLFIYLLFLSLFVLDVDLMLPLFCFNVDTVQFPSCVSPVHSGASCDRGFDR